MSRIVRSSKYRHVFGTQFKKEDCYDELRITRSAWDSNLIAASTTHFAVIFEAAGGGSFAVVDFKKTGKWDAHQPIITGHKAPVLDVDFNPFNDSMIASVSEDCTGKIWGIPEGGMTDNMSTPLQTLSGHKRKVGCVKFNPVANNVLATAGTDFAVKVWDIEKGSAVLNLEAEHSDLIQSLDWKYNGSMLATTCKDKKLRLTDPRTNKIAGESEVHQGVKGSRVSFLGKKDKIFTVGFSKTSEREFALWDLRDLSKCLNRVNVDTASGVLMPFYDPDTSMLYLAGKGDGNIRYYEIVDEAPYIHFLSEFKSASPQRGMCSIPKRAVNVSECEVARMLKVGVKTVEPISFAVPRKSDVFQDDIYPDCYSGDYSLTSSEWFSGKDAEPKTVSLSQGFVSKPKTTNFVPEVKEEKQMSEKELRDEVEKLSKRVAYLESELVKRDIRIKELEGTK
jgi:coronin-1B/1C/6